jgi:alpha/beta superfamily hydrolase
MNWISARTTIMEMPTQDTPAFWGAVCGAAAVAFVGFSWGGWVTGSSAEALASERATKAVVAALAPICVENFNRGKDASAQLAELKKAKSWERASFIDKGGWATMPGVSTVDNAMASSCAEMIVGSKS